jgi:hypothetical protein
LGGWGAGRGGPPGEGAPWQPRAGAGTQAGQDGWEGGSGDAWGQGGMGGGEGKEGRPRGTVQDADTLARLAPELAKVGEGLGPSLRLRLQRNPCALCSSMHSGRVPGMGVNPLLGGERWAVGGGG